ncbi:hypothetical protein [Bacillus solimangrovi]|uniref:hypothetical protein n=1 Tax=Bacillus solimangrovi TaxID=1305675 RepID=UPI001585FBE2|nr:hypothetical protein [Bacillus solimangrovi]
MRRRGTHRTISKKSANLKNTGSSYPRIFSSTSSKSFNPSNGCGCGKGYKHK